ncbi:tetratricopeptide repeat protein [Schlegelella sp. S2-27]|uniref:Tetratricopeptide repeat protein n=1 Tax=Caldimonas mangrovi TaxID=2944811 RepID=A0ABT0YVM0_9BURK|nr:tetratricopeptide repeat protein [Caldimonas mangrovi]MCM5682809.1 tetratricopeptide repeat protein [Caldimonas mangrovi]
MIGEEAVGVQPGRPAEQAAAPVLEQAEHLMARGLYLNAQALLPALEADDSAQARLTAARLLWHLGARREADGRVLRTWRRHRDDPAAVVDMIRSVGSRRGPYRAWKLLEAHPLPADAPDKLRADWHSLCAGTLGWLRDFERAEAEHRSALALDANEAWVRVEWSYVCEQRDAYDEALAQAREALRLRPGYRPALQAVAHFCTLLGRDDEALALLGDAVRGTQAAALAMPLFELQMERGLHADALQTLDRCRRYLARADIGIEQWLAARRADVALRLGDVAGARAHALLAGGPFYEGLAKRLEDTSLSECRVELPVGFVRQHFNTCAPATLATLSRYWSRPAPHLEIAEAICYDGTPNHSERRWAEEQAFLTREFTVDWDTARALLDAGVPFTLTTVATHSAHLQAVIGYDELRGSLLIRDPSKRTHVEFDAASLFESHRPFGPRGMLLLPHEEAARIAGIALPESELWDGYHEVMYALSRHDRDAAVRAADALRARAPGHRLSLNADRSIAGYDGNEAAALDLTERLLALYPQEPNLQLSKAASLSVLGSREQCADWWATVQAGPGFDPVVAVRYAQFLSEDARRHREVFQLLEKTLTVHPTDGAAWFTLATLLWQRGRREQALQHYRIAACLQDTNEHHAESYVRACHVLHRSPEGFDFLFQRVIRLGPKSAYPVFTLFSQLEAVERTSEGFDLLRDAVCRRPDDPELLLFAAEVHLRYGEPARAGELLEQARPVAKRAGWLRLRSMHCRETGDTAQALALAREASAIEPLNVGFHRLVASLLAQTEGRAAALAHLRQVAHRHEHHFELQHLLLGWLPDDALPEAIERLHHMLRISPHNAWAHRELAIKLSAQRRFDEAWRSAQAALEMAPRQSETHSTLAYVRLREGRPDEARRHLRDAITLSVDNDYAVAALIDLDPSLAARREALDFVRGELTRQVTLGDGLLTFQETARTIMEPDELLAVLQGVLDRREDLWQAWVACGAHLTRMGRLEEALALLEQAIERFPLLPRVYAEQANALLVSGRRDAARDSLQRALRINPAWHTAVRMYVDSVLDEGHELTRALQALEPALHRTPDNADLRALRGWVRWRQGEREAAVRDLQAALAIEPGLRWAWDALLRCAREIGQPERASQAAEEVVRQRPGDALAWLRLAEYAAQPQRALEAAEQGLKLEPHHQPLYEARLQLLLDGGLHAEVEAALDVSPWGAQPPAPIAVFRPRLARRRGDTDAAFATMRALLERDPHHYPAWRELADWYDEADRCADYLEAARQMVRLAPQAAVAHGYLGHAQSRLGDKAGAAEALHRAFSLDPSYGFAGLQLIDLDIEAGRLERAAQTLEALSRHDTSPYLALRQMRHAIARGDPAAAMQALDAIIGAGQVPADLCELALKEAQEAGWLPAVLERARHAVVQGRCARPAARLWLRHQKGGLLPGSRYRAVKRAMERDPGHALKQAFLVQLGEQPDKSLLNRFVGDHRDVLRGDLECWALVGYAYVSHGLHHQTAAWLDDWRQRPDAPAWALDNLALSLRQLGRHRAAREVSNRSLELLPANADALTWVALDHAHEDDLPALQRVLDSVDPAGVNPYFQHLLFAMRGYVEAVQAADSRCALTHFASVHRSGSKDRVLKTLAGVLMQRLLARHTPPWVRPWRRLQFALGWG